MDPALSATADEPLKVIAPLPEASMVAPAGPIVKERSVLPPNPMYLSTPPSMTRLAAALGVAPRPLEFPPLANVSKA